ncbi:hypothetical protein M406DRAFT_263476 [Cryphonectria parasitica EP155]|uniref:Uncharacterized protein n=1 Tax=Cryphonectria parasitica (strain ATCC 38755 / EP155) TaxID=660469 RepID=A0A9P5CMF8_CRYP1|nr:uncharacterized protein M406DRAFT_263476 [Cryphonectria parasitica EP155]KAF3762845.1 hypothetical protein M406DRAFT_263476 [Cryphonectria parasitica EP155]
MDTLDDEGEGYRTKDASLRESAAAAASEGLYWRPFYLRRRVLTAFLVTFALIVCAIEVLLAVSNRNDGFTTAASGEYYLWTYGPTAFLTLIAAAFSRVEYQSKISAPWEHMARQASKAADCLLLDYVSEFQLVTIYKALRNRDFTVAATTIISLMIKLMIVFSTGLITLSLTRVHRDSVAMILQDRFTNDNTALAAADTLPYFILQGLIGSNLTYPMGISRDFAFQSVQTGLPSTAQSQVSVDGLTNSLVCEAIDLNMTGSAPPDPHYSENTMNLTITARDCEMKLRLMAPDFTVDNENGTTLFSRFAQGQCNGTSDESGRRVLVMFGNLGYYTDTSQNVTDYTGQYTFNPIRGILHKSAQLLCTPSYTITTVNLIQNGTNVQNVTLAPEASNHTLDTVTAWNIMDAHFAAYNNMITNIGGYWTDTTIYVDGQEHTLVDVDQYSSLMLQLEVASDMNSSTLFNETILQQVATAYYRQFGAIVAKQFLFETAHIPTTGKAILMENRLVVRLWSGQSMAAIGGGCCILALVCILTIEKQGVVPRDPSTLYGIAAIISHSSGVLSKLRDLGDGDEETFKTSLEASSFRSEVTWAPSSGLKIFRIRHASTINTTNRSYQRRTVHAHPVVLNPAVRVILGLILVALIVALELTLRKSNRDDGLGDIANDTYIHYLWTSLPSVVFGGIAMLFSAIDFKTRSLIPYLLLDKVVRTKTFMSFHLLDASVPYAIWKEIGLRNVGAVATTTTLLVASFFTIFSGSLFREATFPTSRTLTLRADDSFPVDTYVSDAASLGDVAASLILESNLTFPNFTYENLVFPQFLLNTSWLPEQEEITDFSGLAIKSIVPSLRGSLQCQVYDSSSIHTNLTLNYTSSDTIHNPLWIDIDGEDCGSDAVKSNPAEFKDTQYWYALGFSVETNMSYFGQGGVRDDDSNGCSDILFAWGHLDFGDVDDPIQHIAAMGCNNSFETVEVETTFIGTNLAIDPAQPPRPLEYTAHNTTSWNTLTLMYSYLAEVHTNELLNSFFSLLTTSRWAVPVSMFDGAKDDADTEVAAAIQFQHNIIMAQVLSNTRVPANTTNATLAYPPPADLTDGNDAIPLYTAVATDTTGRRRVAQDTASTRILEVLLAITLVLLLVGWADVRHTNVLAASPTTIASVVALLAGGNVVQQMPADAEWSAHENIQRVLGPETNFWLGWGNAPDDEGLGMSNENHNRVRRFGIFAARNAEEIEMKLHKPGTDSGASSLLLRENVV